MAAAGEFRTGVAELRTESFSVVVRRRGRSTRDGGVRCACGGKLESYADLSVSRFSFASRRL
jgi:hypothetical protein